MVEFAADELFESDHDGRRRSVLFAIVVATAFLTVAAGSSTLFSAANTLLGVLLVGVGFLLLAFGAAIAVGAVDHLLFD